MSVERVWLPLPRAWCRQRAPIRIRGRSTSLDFGQAPVMTFLPNGDFLIGDGHQNGRTARCDAQGEFVSEFGSVGSPRSPAPTRRGGWAVRSAWMRPQPESMGKRLFPATGAGALAAPPGPQ
jgi:hypothetical protein